MSDVDTRIRAVLSEMFSVKPDEISASTSMDTVERWDSLQHISLVLALEEEFGVRFTADETTELLSYPLIKLILAEHDLA